MQKITESEINKGLSILICCNKGDYHLTKVLIGSIRYYYPTVEIYLLRDYLKGNFNTREIEKYWNVKTLSLGIEKYGWSAAKMHFYMSDALSEKKILVLDSDIVFVGNLLHRLLPVVAENDVIVSPEKLRDIPWTRRQYYDIDIVHQFLPDFIHPGYYFNCGQLVARSKLFTAAEVANVFDTTAFPYWKNLKDFPLVDQAVLNYLLPYKEQKGEIKIGKVEFYFWIDTDTARNITLKEIKEGNTYQALIHWAGNERIPFVYGMIRSDILVFFQKFYYKKIPYGNFKRIYSMIPSAILFSVKTIFRRVRRKYKALQPKPHK